MLLHVMERVCLAKHISSTVTMDPCSSRPSEITMTMKQRSIKRLSQTETPPLKSAVLQTTDSVNAVSSL